MQKLGVSVPSEEGREHCDACDEWIGQVLGVGEKHGCDPTHSESCLLNSEFSPHSLFVCTGSEDNGTLALVCGK
jgi:hypothetical protein